MFRKLVANLPFNPGLLNQVGFYAGRLRQEKAIRRIGLVCMVLAMIVQTIAVMSPPERSFAASANLIIDGLQNRQDILSAYDNPNGDVKAIFSSFNITRGDLESLPYSPNATIRSNDGNDWWTIGRTSLWGYTNVQDIYRQSQQTIQYAGAGTTTTADDSFVYARQLRAWDIRNPYNTYRAFQGKSSTTGQSFWILVDCGNITWNGNWQRPTPPPGPKLQIKKSVAKSTETLKPGDSFVYRLEYRNEVIGSVAQNVVIEDDLDLKNFDVISPRGLDIRNGRLFYPVGTLNGSTSFNILELTVRLKNPLPSPLQICNVARIVSSNAAVAQSENACVNVLTPCPYDPSIPDVNNPNCTKPAVVCSVVDAAIHQTTRTVTFKTTVTTSNNSVVTIKSYNYDFGDDSQQSFSSNSFVHQTEHVFRPGTFTTSVTVRYRAPSDSGVTDQRVSCQVPITIDEDKPLGQEKNVANLTQGLSGDAVRNSRVAGGDVLEYTLYTLNSQNYDRANVTISDYIGDILDYASLDLEALKATGGTFDATTNKVIWANITIPATSKHISQFKVTLKNPIPTTNQPSTVSTSFDCRISNQYGNEITLQVQCPVVKGIETIPNTGPGTSIIGGMSITLIVGYFFARARLLSKELDIIRTDYVATGGM